MNSARTCPYASAFVAQDLGIPVRRTRFVAAAVNQEQLVWVGPATQAGVMDEFLQLFGRAVQLECDAFCGLDSQANLEADLLDSFRGRQIYGTIAELRALPFGSHLPPSQVLALAGYEKLFNEGDKVGAGGAFMADVSQNPEERPRCGPWVQTLARSSHFVSVSKKHTYSRAELDFAMGFPTIPLKNACFEACNAYPVHKLPWSGYRKITGNGMHLASMMAWWMYVCMNCVRRDALQRWAPQVPTPNPAPDESDEAA